MYAEIKQIIARKGPESPPSSLTNTGAQTTSLDAVQLTSILSASGFHLDHFDLDRSKRSANPGTGDVLIEITCQRSGIVSRMHHAPAQCSCPTEEDCTSERSAIWDVQGAAPNGGGAGDAVSSSSNLLPQLSPRKVQITKHLIKVMLEVFEAKDDRVAADRQNNNLAVNGNGNGLLGAEVSPLPNGQPQGKELFVTPVSSINVTPMKPDDFVAEVVGLPKVLLNGEVTATELQTNLDANMTQATFASPNSDIFTSSPNTTPNQIRALPANERDQVVASLRQIRRNIDSTLSMLDFDSTRNINDPSFIAPAEVGARPQFPKGSSLAPGSLGGSTAANRRHSLSVLSGNAAALRAGAARRLGAAASAAGSASTAVGGIATTGRASIGGALRRPGSQMLMTSAESAAARRQMALARSKTTAGVATNGAATSSAVHVSTPRPSTGAAPAQRLTLVQRNSMAAAANSRAASSLSKSTVTRSMSRLPTTAGAATATAKTPRAATPVAAAAAATTTTAAPAAATIPTTEL